MIEVREVKPATIPVGLMIAFSTVFKRLDEIARTDMTHKDIFQLLTSCNCELGELSEELLIKYRVYGSTYKKSDEGPRIESVDLIIAAMAVYYAESWHDGIDSKIAHLELAEIMGRKLSKWENSQK